VARWSPQPGFDSFFPKLSRLLRLAEATELSFENEPHLLFTWRGEISWLSPAPSREPPGHLHPHHATLLRSFGGIAQRFNEPQATWLRNHQEVLTEREAAHDASFLQAHASAFAKAPGFIPIAVETHYSIAREARGNITLCNAQTGNVLLFAPDHQSKHVTPLAGCAEKTLYTINGVKTFAEWVEAVAQQWLKAVGP
jgi:hypothetical protein